MGRPDPDSSHREDNSLDDEDTASTDTSLNDHLSVDGDSDFDDDGDREDSRVNENSYENDEEDDEERTDAEDSDVEEDGEDDEDDDSDDNDDDLAMLLDDNGDPVALNEVEPAISDERSLNEALKIAKPLCIIFYADKNKLSSFGTQKGYPVVVRCALLPTSIRNGQGIGGGLVVGWLPIVRNLFNVQEAFAKKLY